MIVVPSVLERSITVPVAMLQTKTGLPASGIDMVWADEMQ